MGMYGTEVVCLRIGSSGSRYEITDELSVSIKGTSHRGAKCK